MTTVSGRGPFPIRRDRRRVVIEHVAPQVDGGRFPAKRVIGEFIDVEADVFADGHDALRVVLRHRPVRVGGSDAAWALLPMRPLGNDRWTARFTGSVAGYVEFAVVAWIDRFESWRHELQVKFDNGDVVGTELIEGAGLVRRAATHLRTTPGSGPSGVRFRVCERLFDYAGALEAATPQRERVDLALSAELAADMAAWNPPIDPVTHAPIRVRIERERAGFAAWYEMFPRSETPDRHRSATFDEAARRLPDIAGMGFDVLYLPPIHPIGHTGRKGRNNAPEATAFDPGSPWAIGSTAGGHKAVHPDLGTLEDFDRFVQRAAAAGLEVAIDLAFQCSPDHPYVREHPEWFRHRPDGTIKYAENPPKKYQDIFPFDFECDAWEALWDELRSVVFFWIDHGVRTFRVDNPHTKPFAFWEWLIGEVHRVHPDVIFLSEAFTRPKLMQRLAKVGFTQSYSYFTWRNTKAELEAYFTELTATDVREYLRPNLFTNTPDILHAYLQEGGRPAFAVRLLLAATLGTVYGIYSGFELGENVPLRPGSEEYKDSEKYEIRPRDWNQPGSLAPLMTRINAIRRAHPAFRAGSRLAFHRTDNDHLLCFSRESQDGRDRVLVVVNLDPVRLQHGWVDVPAEAWRLPEEGYTVSDELGGERYQWTGSRTYVRLEPGSRPAHVLAMPAPAEESRS
jgi:starch synthase (maltosyl-transferring)